MSPWTQGNIQIVRPIPVTATILLGEGDNLREVTQLNYFQNYNYHACESREHLSLFL